MRSSDKSQAGKLPVVQRGQAPPAGAGSPRERGALNAGPTRGSRAWDANAGPTRGSPACDPNVGSPCSRPACDLNAAVACEAAWPLIGESGVMRTLRERIERVAVTDFTVLVEGESGSGKELVARQLHERSRRRYGPFIALNCAAIVETLLEAELFGIEDRTATGVRGRKGKFEEANAGTIFLDEVSDLSPSAQAKLLRVLQDRAVQRVGGTGSHKVDTRIVAATNRSLQSLVERRRFRTDLFYRLSGVEVRVPSLRERREDIRMLAVHFLSRHAQTPPFELSAAAAGALFIYHWPGNVRELERVIERAVALAKTHVIGLEDLPPGLRGRYRDVLLPSVEQSDTLRAWGSRYVQLVLERSGRNKRSACRKLGISYHTLQAYLRYSSRMHPKGDERIRTLEAGNA